MEVLVSDTSVIIDLDRGNLLEDIFRLDHHYCVPDLLFENELSGALGDRLLELGLKIVELSADEAGLAQVLKLEKRNRRVCLYACHVARMDIAHRRRRTPGIGN